MLDSRGRNQERCVNYFTFAKIGAAPAFGVPLVRSLVWNVAALGMTLMLVALLWK